MFKIAKMALLIFSQKYQNSGKTAKKNQTASFVDTSEKNSDSISISYAHLSSLKTQNGRNRALVFQMAGSESVVSKYRSAPLQRFQEVPAFTCSTCHKSFSLNQNLQRHIKRTHTATYKVGFSFN